MPSPPEHNVLLDPLAELSAALDSHAFGLASCEILLGECYPHNAAERRAVQQASGSRGVEATVQAKARLVLLGGEEVVVVLDARGYSIESSSSTTPAAPATYESLDALLIARSPAYVQAMQAELMKRFESDTPRRWDYADGQDAEEEVVWID